VKILWVSNAPWASSGYGTQTRQVVPRLAAAGHQVAIAANFGLQGHMLDYEIDGQTIRIYPTGYTQYSADVIPGHALDWFHDTPGQGQVITLFDVWAMRNEQLADLNIAAWCPVDHMPAPPAVVKWFHDYGATPIAMAQYGREQLTRAGLDTLYVPHSYEPDVLYPEDQGGARRALGLPEDRFIVGIVAANIGRFPPRKAWAEQFAAFARFHHEHPDSLLYVHANQYPDLDGLELDVLAMGMAVPPDALVFADQYVVRRGASDRTMRLLYSAFDVLSFTSMGEGFGLPALEAQACGTPCIVSDFSAQRELVAAEDGLGWRVAVQPSWDPTQRACFAVPLISSGPSSILAAYRDAYARRGDLIEMGEKCAERVKPYEADRVFEEHWLPVLDYLESRLPTTEPIRL
jgi:glycosyltransferase involved in cell wall biosynthesis